ncbi:MAG: hypothetical protein J2P36_25710 [Ktedonobacteraceae bacterium]|nr:hypothetical protein [Ktedonobacteraceae bacterium]
MPKGRKTIPAGTIDYTEANIHVPVTVDRDTGQFRATFGGEVFEHTERRGLNKVVFDAIKKATQLTWTPIIELEPLNSSHVNLSHDAIFAFALERKWITRLPDGSFKEVQWDAQGDKEKYRLLWSHPFRWEKTDFTLPHVWRRYEKVTCYLPYSEQLYKRLQELQEIMKALRLDLLELLQTQDGLESLMLRDFSLTHLREE